MQTDFNYREDHSSGFDQNRQKEDDHRNNNSNSQSNNHWMRQSKNGGLDIDEIPIPTAGDRPKTFEELLAEKMEAADMIGAAADNSGPHEVPKKQGF